MVLTAAPQAKVEPEVAPEAAAEPMTPKTDGDGCRPLLPNDSERAALELVVLVLYQVP